jgi:SAM-dependent methyltransferase
MDKPQPNLFFNLMAFGFKFRDLIRPRGPILKEAGLQKGFYVLDYGCGPGRYFIPAMEIIGTSGLLFAADIHPLAIEYIRKIAAKKRYTNVKTILTDCDTGLDNESMDAILFMDIYHGLKQPEPILNELHRILKPNACLSVSDHHMKIDTLISRLTSSELFHLSKQGLYVLNFTKFKNA